MLSSSQYGAIGSGPMRVPSFILLAGGISDGLLSVKFLFVWQSSFTKQVDDTIPPTFVFIFYTT